MISKREWYAALRRVTQRVSLIFGGVFMMAAMFYTIAWNLPGGRGDYAADLRCVHRVRDGMKIMKSPCKTCRLAAACEKHTSRKCTIWIAWFTHTWDKLCELAKKQWGYWNSEDES